MAMRDFKRKLFFWIERLQISRAERISVLILMGLLMLLLLSNYFLTQNLNFRQENYDRIMEEFNRKSEVLKSEERLRRQRLSVNVDSAVSVPESTSNKMAVDPVGKVNINTAGLSELQQLKGIGETYARRIIDYRKEHGRFESIEELINVKGIGKKRLDTIRPFIKLQ